MTQAALQRKINIALALALAVNLFFWFVSSDVYARWAGVPPVPSQTGSVMMALGDAEFSFRSGSLTLQNLGDGGGNVTPLKDYDYSKLGKWFWLLHDLDPASDHVPMTAAYYFGATRVPSDVRVVVGYLAAVGQNPVGDKWRWLAHAVYLARHRLKDMDLALDLAYKLAKMQPVSGELPMWARQMPAFVLKARGDKEDARQIIGNLMMDRNLDHNELNFMKSYMVEQLGVTDQDAESLVRLRGK